MGNSVMMKGLSSLSLPPDSATRLASLENALRRLESVLVAYSGGVDSTLVAVVAHRVLGEKALAVTADAAAFPRREVDGARDLARRLGLRHRVVEVGHLQRDAFAHNPPDRCYRCKRRLFSLFRDVAREEGLAQVIDGTNADDAGEHRPGRKALQELGVRSPLLETGFGKADIRAVSRALALPTADRPSCACLATRFPYGATITDEDLWAVGRAEEALHDLGYAQVRVRVHGNVARIELDRSDLPRAIDPDVSRRIVDALKDCGFTYVTLDLQGYRTGSMDEEARAPGG